MVSRWAHKSIMYKWWYMYITSGDVLPSDLMVSTLGPHIHYRFGVLVQVIAVVSEDTAKTGFSSMKQQSSMQDGIWR